MLADVVELCLRAGYFKRRRLVVLGRSLESVELLNGILGEGIQVKYIRGDLKLKNTKQGSVLRLGTNGLLAHWD
jgi:hypothetical protein